LITILKCFDPTQVISNSSIPLLRQPQTSVPIGIYKSRHARPLSIIAIAETFPPWSSYKLAVSFALVSVLAGDAEPVLLEVALEETASLVGCTPEADLLPGAGVLELLSAAEVELDVAEPLEDSTPATLSTRTATEVTASEKLFIVLVLVSVPSKTFDPTCTQAAVPELKEHDMSPNGRRRRSALQPM
jgi:hypothetical protein